LPSDQNQDASRRHQQTDGQADPQDSPLVQPEVPQGDPEQLAEGVLAVGAGEGEVGVELGGRLAY